MCATTTAGTVSSIRQYPLRLVWDSEPIAPILLLEAFRCRIVVSFVVLQNLLNITDKRRLHMNYEQANSTLRITGIHQHYPTNALGAFLDNSIQVHARTCLSTEDIRCGGLSRTLQISASMGSLGRCFAVTRIREMRLHSRQLLTGNWGYVLMDSAHRLCLENGNESVFDHFAANMPLPAVGVWRVRPDAAERHDESSLRDPMFLQQLDAFATLYATTYGRQADTPFLVLLLSNTRIETPEESCPFLFECKRCCIETAEMTSTCSLRVSAVRNAAADASGSVLGCAVTELIISGSLISCGILGLRRSVRQRTLKKLARCLSPR
jgi:hypothetical protein